MCSAKCCLTLLKVSAARKRASEGESVHALEKNGDCNHTNGNSAFKTSGSLSEEENFVAIAAASDFFKKSITYIAVHIS